MEYSGITFTNKAAGEMRETCEQDCRNGRGECLGFHFSFRMRQDSSQTYRGAWIQQ